MPFLDIMNAVLEPYNLIEFYFILFYWWNGNIWSNGVELFYFWVVNVVEKVDISVGLSKEGKGGGHVHVQGQSELMHSYLSTF